MMCGYRQRATTRLPDCNPTAIAYGEGYQQAIALGSPETGSQRLSMAGGVNNFGTTIGPLLVTAAIYGSMGSGSGSELDVSAVKVPY